VLSSAVLDAGEIASIRIVYAVTTPRPIAHEGVKADAARDLHVLEISQDTWRRTQLIKRDYSGKSAFCPCGGHRLWTPTQIRHSLTCALLIAKAGAV
jgi:hypothetical protein